MLKLGGRLAGAGSRLAEGGSQGVVPGPEAACGACGEGDGASGPEGDRLDQEGHSAGVVGLAPSGEGFRGHHRPTGRHSQAQSHLGCEG